MENGNFVKPIIQNFAMVGHSYGGVITADLAVNFENHKIPKPVAKIPFFELNCSYGWGSQEPRPFWNISLHQNSQWFDWTHVGTLITKNLERKSHIEEVSQTIMARSLFLDKRYINREI